MANEKKIAKYQKLFLVGWKMQQLLKNNWKNESDQKKSWKITKKAKKNKDMVLHNGKIIGKKGDL